MFKTCTACKKSKSILDFYRHPNAPLGRACKCIPCSKKINLAAYYKNHSARRAHANEYKRIRSAITRKPFRNALPPEFAELEVGPFYRTVSKEFKRARERIRYHENEKYKAANTNKANRRRTCRVPWANTRKIEEIYKEARRISRETGIKHSVDHIVPIKSDFVCGLHVENNLRIVPATENARKKNKFVPGLISGVV